MTLPRDRARPRSRPRAASGWRGRARCPAAAIPWRPASPSRRGRPRERRRSAHGWPRASGPCRHGPARLSQSSPEGPTRRSAASGPARMASHTLVASSARPERISAGRAWRSAIRGGLTASGASSRPSMTRHPAGRVAARRAASRVRDAGSRPGRSLCSRLILITLFGPDRRSCPAAPGVGSVGACSHAAPLCLGTGTVARPACWPGGYPGFSHLTIE